MTKLLIAGEVDRPVEFTFEDLAALPLLDQIDMASIDPKRTGDAISLATLLRLVSPNAQAKFIGLHASKDNFHASIPLAPVRDTAVLIYRVAGKPLDTEAGGPFRFYIPNHKACKTDDIDECANVKYVERIEFTSLRGHDNRPRDEKEHSDLHKKE